MGWMYVPGSRTVATTRPSFEPFMRAAGTPQTDDFSYPRVFPDSSAAPAPTAGNVPER